MAKQTDQPKRQVQPRDRRGRFTKRQRPPLHPELMQWVGTLRIPIGVKMIELPRLIIPQWTNDEGRWVVINRERTKG
jgi:hypothetical protein